MYHNREGKRKNEDKHKHKEQNNKTYLRNINGIRRGYD